MKAMGALWKAKVRGIYTTALTKLLLDNHFGIVEPSLTIKKRFELSEDSAPPDIKIKDRYDLQGIRVLGTSDAVNRFQSILHSTFEDVLTRKWHANVNGIYKAKAVESDKDTVYVDLGGDVIGRLPRFEFETVDEKPLLVQVERKRIGVRQPILTTKLKIVGNYAILAQNSKVGVSLKIRDLKTREELYALGKMLAPSGWGIIWRTSSANQPRETLENGIRMLAEKVKILNEKALHAEVPTLLIAGSYVMDVEFPWFSKRNMDKLRASTAPTLDGHHFYKSCGDAVSAALEMAEDLLEKGQSTSEVEEFFKQQIVYEFPEVGSIVDVEHVKLSGMVLHLGHATIERLDDKQIKYSRIIQSNGFYDGLGVKKEAKDKAVSETETGEWYITTKYFSPSGEWKGTYLNLNTPVEVYPKAIRYVDLEVDVCIQPDGNLRHGKTRKSPKRRGHKPKTVRDC